MLLQPAVKNARKNYRKVGINMHHFDFAVIRRRAIVLLAESKYLLWDRSF